MVVHLSTTPALSANLRIVSALTAALSAVAAALGIFRGTTTALQLSIVCAGVVTFGSLAFFGYRPGWSRAMTHAAIFVLAALSAWRLAGAVV